jgi:hypothetical protein
MASFKQLQPSDFVISSDSVSGTLWSTGNPTLTTFFTSSTQAASSAGDYYLSVYQTGSGESNAAIQFDIAYANADGSGSLLFDSAVNGQSPTRSLYGQYRNLVLEDENAQFVFGGVTQSDFYVLNFERAQYKQELFLGSFNLRLTGSAANRQLDLTDNSQETTVVQYNGAGRVYQLISGSNGEADTQLNANGYTTSHGSYGLLLPDIGVALLNAKALDLPTGEGVALATATGSNTDNNNNAKLFAVIGGGGSGSFSLNSQETISSDFIFVRAQNQEFNYSENPSFISGSSGEVIFQSFINNPQTYATTVGLYNDTNDLVAVAKLSRPLEKDFTKETLVRIKLDF